MKAYTDLEQSKKLAEILPIKSADMLYWLGEYITHPYIEGQHKDEQIPIWSLTALLGVLPNENMLVKTTDGEYYCLAKDVMTKHYDNPVDACYEMILKLNEWK